FVAPRRRYFAATDEVVCRWPVCGLQVGPDRSRRRNNLCLASSCDHKLSRGNTMRISRIEALLFAAGVMLAGGAAHAMDITGAGATFPFPIYSKWADAYKQKTGNGMNYQSIGSGGGIAQIKAKTVDFGASDMPLKPEDLQSAGLTQFPAII